MGIYLNSLSVDQSGEADARSTSAMLGAELRTKSVHKRRIPRLRIPRTAQALLLTKVIKALTWFTRSGSTIFLDLETGRGSRLEHDSTMDASA